jgi:hypothetical protein
MSPRDRQHAATGGLGHGLGGLLDHLFFQIKQGQVVTFRGEVTGQGRAQTLGRAGDDCCFSR